MRAPGLAGLLWLGACSPMCTEQTVTTLWSPNGDHHAVLFMRECGATTDFSTQVSVDPGPIRIGGNAFIADAYRGGTRGSWGGPWARIAWIAPNTLLIAHDADARIFVHNHMVDGVRIVYRPIRGR